MQLNNLKHAVENECEDVRSLIQEIVPTYVPNVGGEEYEHEKQSQKDLSCKSYHARG